ncbi:MAG: hypothetical protein SFX73_38470 [Kofleriaceae bacterium]|nr:hypothetical protein [Kofleriaceae bacterium]
MPALFVSGYTDRRLDELGAMDVDSAFIGKPFRGEELVAAVRALLLRGG